MTKLVEAMDDDVKNLLKTTSAIRSKSETDAKELEKSIRSMAAEVEEQKTEKSYSDMKMREITDQMRTGNHQFGYL